MNLKREDITDKELMLISKQRKAKQKQERANEVKKEKKLMEFSKKIMFFVYLQSIVNTIFSMYIINKTGNTTYLDILIIETFKLSRIAVIFYYIKAGVENYQKIKNQKLLQLQETINQIDLNNQEEII